MDVGQFTKQGAFLLAALDHRGSFRRILNPHDPRAVTDVEITQVKQELLSAMAAEVSGYLVDVEHRQAGVGLPEKPMLLAIEKSGYQDVEGERLTELAYTVEELKSYGAKGVKLLLYFNPRLPNAKKQIMTAKSVLDGCKKNNLPFFFEILTYTKESNDPQFELIIESVGVFLKQNIVPDVFKLEYPGSAENCKKVTAMVGKTPWILLTRADPYDVFVKKLETACLHGASGFLAGRALWQEIKGMAPSQRTEFIRDTVAKRFHEICQIASKNSFLA